MMSAVILPFVRPQARTGEQDLKTALHFISITQQEICNPANYLPGRFDPWHMAGLMSSLFERQVKLMGALLR